MARLAETGEGQHRGWAPNTARERRPFWERAAVRRDVTGWLWATPILVYLGVFLYFPILASFVMALMNWNGMEPLSRATFLGSANLIELTRDRRYIGAYTNSIVYTAVVVTSSIALGLPLALVVSNLKRFVAFVRATYFMPVILPLTSMSLLWESLFFQVRYGLFNQVLGFVGLSPIKWLMSPRTALLSICLMVIWKGLGWYMVIFLAGLAAIPEAYYEAARIDGASRWQMFRHVTVPLLKPTLLFVTVTSAINGLQMFTPVYMMTQGDPINSTNTVVYWLYRVAFHYTRFSYGSAMGVGLFLVILAITLVQMRLFGEGAVVSYYGRD